MLDGDIIPCYKTSMKQIITIIMTIGILLLCGSGLSAQNLVSNPSFEELSADGTPAKWRPMGWYQDSSITVHTVDTSVAHSGSNSALVNNLKNNHAYYVQQVNLQPNTSYRLSGWIRTENIGEGIDGAGISILDKFETGGDVRGTVSSWQQVQLFVQTTSGITSAQVMLQIGNYGAENSGKAWFDDIELVKVDNIPEGETIARLEKTVQPEPAQQEGQTQQLGQKSMSAFTLFIIIAGIIIGVGVVILIVILLMRKKSKESVSSKE